MISSAANGLAYLPPILASNQNHSGTKFRGSVLSYIGRRRSGGAGVGRELDFEDVALSLMGDFQLKAVLFFVFNQ